MFRLANYESLEIKPFIRLDYFTNLFCPPRESTPVRHELSDEEKLNDLFDQAMNLSRQDRAAFLDAQCANDPGLRSKIELLLTGVDAHPPEHFLNPAEIVDQLTHYLHIDKSDG